MDGAGENDEQAGAASEAPDRNKARQQLAQFARTVSLIDPDATADPAVMKRIGEILDFIPARTLADLLENVASAQRRAPLSPEAFCQAHAISLAEGRLLESLLAGLTVTDHAGNAGISINTARTHMRRLLEKTGSASQADLLRRYFAG